jgi:hypothetical protein
MALQAPSMTASDAQSATYLLSLRDAVDAILLDDSEIVNVLGINYDGAVDQDKWVWEEDELNPNTVKAAAAGGLSTGSTVLLLSASQVARITAGTLIKDQLSGKYEVAQCTARSGVSATITRGYNSTSAETHAAAAVWDIVANPRPQGMAGPKDESVARTRSYNFTQIFSKGVSLTGTAEAIKHNGIANEDSYQVDKRLRELMRELDSTVIKGIRSSTRSSSTVYGTMGGLIDYVKHAASGNTNSTAETISPSVVNAMNKQIWDDGGMPDILLVGGVQKQKISLFDREYRRSTMDSRRAGFEVVEFLTDLGNTLRVVVDRWMPVDCALVLDSSRIAIRPLVGRDFFIEQLAKTGDFTARQIVGEYTLEVRQAAKAHAIHWNLKQ